MSNKIMMCLNKNNSRLRYIQIQNNFILRVFFL